MKVWPLFHVEKVGEWINGKLKMYDDPIVFKLNKDLFYSNDNTEEIFESNVEDLSINNGL
jgi:hypothetical protein